MRRHAKAATAGSTSTRRRVLSFGVFTAILAALALVAALADAAVPTASTGSASGIQKTAATLNGTVNPQGALLEECQFEYGTTTSYGQSAPCNLTPAEIGTGTSPVTVTAEITGLSIGTTYHFRLHAKNAEGASNGSDQSFKTLSPPILSAWTEGVVREEATLKAQVNPEGFATTYKFQWGPTAAYSNETAPANAGSDNANHLFGKALTGLTPGATYHYRVVATNANGTTETADHTFTTYLPGEPQTGCPNQVYRIGPGANLPDCRAYEMVSPVDKNGGDITYRISLSGRPLRNQSSLDGDKITYSSGAAFAGALSHPYVNQYIATRTPGGWFTESISPPERGGVSGGGAALIEREYYAFTPDLSYGWLQPESVEEPLAPGALPGNRNLYRRDNATGAYQTVSVGQNGGTPLGSVLVQGISKDGKHTVFRTHTALTPGAPSSSDNLYDWTDEGMRLVNVLPNGSPYSGLSSVGAPEAFVVPAVDGAGYMSNVTHAVSDDGSRVVWTAITTPALGEPGSDGGHIYVRVDGERTVAVSESVTSLKSIFMGASTDGSKVIFTAGAPAESSPKPLYEFDVDTETPTLIAPEVLGVAATSDDASYVYFVSTAVLDSGAVAGGRNLYLHHGASNIFIATLSNPETTLEGGGVNSPFSLISRARVAHLAGVTPDGHDFTFISNRSLTGYDSTDSSTGEAVGEVYRYDAAADRLTCISCNPSGSRPSASGGVVFKSTVAVFDNKVAAWVPAWQDSLYQSRSMTDDGNRVFFNSYDALLPQDTNGVEDVYEWEAPGTGGCSETDSSFSALNEGCISLISSGQSASLSEFVDADPSGRDVFVRTNESLLPQDPGLYDIYDARVDGGFLSPSESSSCVGDTCQSPPPSPPASTPSSASFKGAGNPAPNAVHSCTAQARQAAELNRKARALRKRASGSGKQAAHLRHQAARYAKQAKELDKRAARCRRAERRAAR